MAVLPDYGTRDALLAPAQALQLRVPAPPTIHICNAAVVSSAHQGTPARGFRTEEGCAVGDDVDNRWHAACQGAVEMRMWAASEAQEQAAAAQPVLASRAHASDGSLAQEPAGGKPGSSLLLQQQATGIAKEEPGVLHPFMIFLLVCMQHAWSAEGII